jgi:hypothetical protein
VTKSTVLPLRSRATRMHTCSFETPRFDALPPRLRAGRCRLRAPFCDSRRNVSSASAIPLRQAGRSALVSFKKRWRQRRLVFLATPTRSAALRTVRESSMHSLKSSHLSLWRRRASGVPVRLLNVLPQARQRKRCSPLLVPCRYSCLPWQRGQHSLGAAASSMTAAVRPWSTAGLSSASRRAHWARVKWALWVR